jgi:TP901 family phage tail tape measure protein
LATVIDELVVKISGDARGLEQALSLAMADTKRAAASASAAVGSLSASMAAQARAAQAAARHQQALAGAMADTAARGAAARRAGLAGLGGGGTLGAALAQQAAQQAAQRRADLLGPAVARQQAAQQAAVAAAAQQRHGALGAALAARQQAAAAAAAAAGPMPAFAVGPPQGSLAAALAPQAAARGAAAGAAAPPPGWAAPPWAGAAWRGATSALQTGLQAAGSAAMSFGSAVVGAAQGALHASAAYGGISLGGPSGTATAAGMGAAIAAVGGAGVHAFTDFNSALVKSTAIRDVAPEQMERMKQKALEMSLVTARAPAEFAEAYYFLASAGMQAEAAISALSAVHKFAAAGAMDVATATEALVGSLAALGLKSADAGQNLTNMMRVSDVVVRASKLAQGTTLDYAQALTRDGAAALKMFGISLEDGMSILAAYGEQNITGAFAGGQLARGLRYLASSATKYASVWREYGIEVFDAAGNMRYMGDIMADFEAAFAGKSSRDRGQMFRNMGIQVLQQKALVPLIGRSATMFGFRGKLESAGKEGWSATVAEKQLASFANQAKMMKNAVTVALIGVGEVLAPVLGQATALAREATLAWLSLPAGLKELGVWAGVAAAALLLLSPALRHAAGAAVALGRAVFAVALGPAGPLLLAATAAVVFVREMGGVGPAWQAVQDAVAGALGWVQKFIGENAAVWEGFRTGFLSVATAALLAGSALSGAFEFLGGLAAGSAEGIAIFLGVAAGLAVTLKLAAVAFGLVSTVLATLRVQQVASLGLWVAWQAVLAAAAATTLVYNAVLVVHAAITRALKAHTVAWYVAVAGGYAMVLVATVATKAWAAAMVLWQGVVIAAKLVWAAFGLALMAVAAPVAVAIALLAGASKASALGAAANALAWMAAKVALIAFGVAAALVKAVTWLLNAALTVTTALLGSAVIVGGAAVFLAIGAALVVVASAAYGVWRAAKAAWGAITDLATTEGVVNHLSAMFGDWWQMMKDVVEVAKTDMPGAFELLRAGADVAVNQLQDLWPPLWQFIRIGFKSLGEVVATEFQLSFYSMMADLAGKIATLGGILGADVVAAIRFRQMIGGTEELSARKDAAEKALSDAQKGFHVEEKEATFQAKERFAALRGEKLTKNLDWEAFGPNWDENFDAELWGPDWSMAEGEAVKALRTEQQQQKKAKKGADPTLGSAAGYGTQEAFSRVSAYLEGVVSPQLEEMRKQTDILSGIEANTADMPDFDAEGLEG